ncbi:hypothetical protein HY382_02245 [Candidatus Curtissbacteria bacterium]|nr:hypothetical protein [Candidatus Curtissbacteria bacterium]
MVHRPLFLAPERFRRTCYYTFFPIKFSPGSYCTEVLFGSAKYALVGRWQSGRLVQAEGKNGSKPKRLEEDPSDGYLKIAGLVSGDRIFLHQVLVRRGPEQVGAYCAQLMGKLSENGQG